MTTETYPDVEGAIRTWLRADATVVSLVAQRVFFEPPDSPYYPLVLVQRVGGGDAPGEVPLDLALIQLSVIGKRRDEGGSKLNVTALKNAVKASMRGIRGRTNIAPGVDAADPECIGDVYTRDDDSRPRYVLTYQVSAIASA